MITLKSNIVIVTSEFPPQPGGIGNHAYNLALHLSNLGYQVKVIADQRSKTGDEELEFDKSLPFSVERIKLYKFRFIMYLKRIILTIKYIKSATYCIATGKFSLWNVAFCRLFFNRKTIAVVHGTEVNFKSALLRKSINFSLKRFDEIVAVSNYTKSLISHLNKKIIVIPNGITTSEWKNSKEKIKLKGQPVITTVGRVSSRKGQLNVIQHLPQLVKQFPELHYHCVGIPTEADAFIKVAESLKVASYVTFHGSVTEDELKQSIEATDIFVMLSTESMTGDVEGFGIAILEANAMGIPAIGAKGCGIEDAINNGKSGFLIDVKNTNEFKERILQILQNTTKFKTEAVTWANTHDWSHIIKRYEELF
ncbi:glycosyltransferase family 4 protein [Psychroserpens ponticola]|uniref:Glycosyltransferase family 4 protein n=1 Tax=Psychroserpens ponticola TaxID=2932268 RepID=A0ABY7S0P0_9FLAO|nr:glycosyltransferase family 4 protein [Psychroserpens ponticola]WCO02540.1 glycosyltransferase family 4 protein [Psychroserpens ponticola]